MNKEIFELDETIEFLENLSQNNPLIQNELQNAVRYLKQYRRLIKWLKQI